MRDNTSMQGFGDTIPHKKTFLIGYGLVEDTLIYLSQ